jgi:hypothetical protein
MQDINLLKYKLLQNEQLNPSNIINVIVKAMELVEVFFKDTPGTDKKTMVLSIIYEIVDDSNMTEENKKLTLQVINNIYSPLVDSIIAISKGNTELNKKINGCFSWMSKCINKNHTL